MIITSDLIFDIGMHEGQDTEFYLAKEFRVVAVEANPLLTNAASAKFQSHIVAGRLVILNVGVAHQRGQMPFYINKTISEWSSFDPEIASRGHPIETVTIPTVTVADILMGHGIPHYAKIDIEGYDHIAVRGLIERPEKPAFISYENPNPGLFEDLVKAGYSRFKNVSQSKVAEYRCPIPPREGAAIEHIFVPGSSGPFGEETPGQWMNAEQMRPLVHQIERERIEALRSTVYPEWFDMHAAL